MASGTSYSPPPAFGRFKLLHQIGAGVLGPVFRTHDPDHERLVAVKAFTLDLTPEQAHALAEELTRLAALGIDAPSLAAPVAAGIEEFVPYVAVPYVSGESLDAAIRQYGPAPAGDAMRLISHVAEALDAAAQAGVHHGSLHPRDIIVTPGETHVTGMGVAQALERVGLHGPVRRPYVAPERESGEEWGAAADIYALAAIAYEVLTGRRALPGTDQPLPGLTDLHVHDAAGLRDVLESALDADPGRRPARARDFAMGFAAALAEGSAGGAAGDRAERKPRKPRTRPQKLPGLDEPLGASEGTARHSLKMPPTPAPAVVAPAAVPPSVVQPETLRQETVQAGPEPGRALPEIRYVPVSDPSDAGGAGPDFAALSAAPPDVPREPLIRHEPAPPSPLDLPSAVLSTGFTPDLRMADELLARPEAGGETVDADLALALDRLAGEHGAGPTPAVIGLDILGPGPPETSAIEGIAAGGINLDLAPAVPLAPDSPELREPLPPPPAPTPQAVPPATSALADAGGDVGERSVPRGAAFEFVEAEALPEPAAGVRESEPDLAAIDALLPAIDQPAPTPALPTPPPGATPAAVGLPAGEPEATRPFAGARVGPRRRPPSRYSRLDLTPPPAEGGAAPDAEVPKAFEPRRTPPARSAPDFELLTRAASNRPPVVPVAVGVVAGLILGLAGGYWLGSRSAEPGASVPPKAVATVPPAAAAPTAAPPARQADTAPPPAAARVPAAGTALPPAGDRALPPPVTAAAPPAAGKPAASGAAATRGSVQVTASVQANVYLDGERTGMTPRSLRNIPLGSHTVRVTRPGYEPQEQTVVLTADEPSAAVSFTLRRGAEAPAAPAGRAPAVKSVLTVFIDSVPQGARIIIDGRDLAPTPLTVRQMRPGTHTIELRLAGYRPWSQRITVAAGDDRRITATLERNTTR